jgi:large subunit ribosomal protein L4
MPKVDIFNISGQQVGEIELSDDIFNAEINQSILHTVVKNYLANQRQGTQSVKTRAEVSGGGRKPWRQKGTGRARQGSIRAPQWIGGGVAFAPKPRDYSYKLSKKAKRVAMKSALTSKLQNKDMIVLDELDIKEPKTKEMVNILKNLNSQKKTLIVLEQNNENVVKSVSNIPGVSTTIVTTLNVYDILNHDKFIVTKDAVHKIEEVYS